MSNNTGDKSRLSGARLVNTDTGSRRSQSDPYGFVGKTLAGRYQIEDLLGIGGMAAVYRAKHLATTRTVAIKILKPDLAYTAPQMVEEFLNEAKATANLNHRNIIEVSDADQDENGTTFLVMQHLKGKPLDDVISDEQPLPFERIANLFEQICDGVQHAHANGIIHRDLKPGNIMVMADGRGDEVIKILDFGIAKAMTATAKVSREIGTIYYASPEQLSKGASIDPRSDIYSLGVILYQMLTGAVPFDDDSVEHIIYQKLNFAPPLMRQMRPEIPAPVEEVIQRALARDPGNRYQDATEMARAFWRAISLETGALVIDCVDAAGRTSLAGASVLINSKYVGQTDVKGHWRQSGMLPRQYLVELESPRYQHWRASIRVDPREEIIVTAEMQPEPKGDLIVSCGVPNAQVDLDQRKIGVADESGRLYIEALDAGKHHIRISHSRYMSMETEVEIGISEQAFLQLDLKPKTVSWWQRPIIVAPAVIALALVGFLIYRLVSRNGQTVPTVIPSTPTPELTQVTDSSPEPTSDLGMSAASPTPTLFGNPVYTPKPGATIIVGGVATPLPTSTPPPTPPPTPHPTVEPPSVASGLSALQRGDYSEAIRLLRQFPRDDGARTGLSEAYFKQGMAFVNRGQYPNALNSFDEGLRVKPDSTKAIDYYGLIASKVPNDPAANFKLCQAYYNRGSGRDFDDAVQKCAHAIVNKGDYAEAYKTIDLAFQQLKGVNGNNTAKEFYVKERQKNPNNPLPIYYQGLVYYRQKKKKDVENHRELLQKLSSQSAAPMIEELSRLISTMK